MIERRVGDRRVCLSNDTEVQMVLQAIQRQFLGIRELKIFPNSLCTDIIIGNILLDPGFGKRLSRTDSLGANVSVCNF